MESGESRLTGREARVHLTLFKGGQWQVIVKRLYIERRQSANIVSIVYR